MTRLTDLDWERVFALRCRSKRGLVLTEAETALLHLAHAEDPKRYAAMSSAVFVATSPMSYLVGE